MKFEIRHFYGYYIVNIPRATTTIGIVYTSYSNTLKHICDLNSLPNRFFQKHIIGHGCGSLAFNLLLLCETQYWLAFVIQVHKLYLVAHVLNPFLSSSVILFSIWKTRISNLD